MEFLGWVVIGFLGGALSAALVGGRTARGCLPNVVVGILGAIVGGWIAQQLNLGQAQGFIAAVVVAVIGAIVVRVILEALSPDDRRRDASLEPIRPLRRITPPRLSGHRQRPLPGHRRRPPAARCRRE